MNAIRFVAGLGLGWAAFSAILTLGFFLLRGIWPAYIVAEPEKAFTLGMLFVRLGIYAAATAGAAGVATLVAGDRRAAWIAGGLILAMSLPAHLYYVWDDYPVWYHFAYLVSIVPIAAYAGQTVRRTLPAPFSHSPPTDEGLRL